ncbi:hypothetical protein PGT21_028889 [Puccinia graminis f. sp. tritici]|uniref:Uncharacterized protein n=1 Tax=Puccinia graminis f. sp. tritici TaxID=56615 RepID=A0A5B0S0J9_PUCGR|nr:hypothetical protein PGT21_028889 [Puccinia graminis f. sp. tritici]KAA1131238.1 hypothetical protein PGTUg99_026518 [Puccinia graminis f. sp. tritici]
MFGLIPAKAEPHRVTVAQRKGFLIFSRRSETALARFEELYLSYGRPRYSVLARARFLPFPPARCLFRATRRFL